MLVLRHQFNVLRRKSPKRFAFGYVDRLVFAGLYRVAPGVLDALKILKPHAILATRHDPSGAGQWVELDIAWAGKQPLLHARCAMLLMP